MKNLDEQETPFSAVPYETAEVGTSISLLTSPEQNIVIRALWNLAKYANTKDANVEYLYQKNIVPKLLELLIFSDLTILRFSLKILSQIITCVPIAAKLLSLEQYSSNVKQINHIFMKTQDERLLEFTAQILSEVVRGATMASYLLRTGVLITIFRVLKTSQDPDVQFNVLTYFNSILHAPEAVEVLPTIADFTPKTIICYLKCKVADIQQAALDIIDKLTIPLHKPMQILLKDERVIENLFSVILNDDFRSMHIKAMDIIHTCMKCQDTASYFVKTLEFIEFCQWAKTCEKRYILPSSVILAALTEIVELRQFLFDFSVEDTILSFFRINNELVFYKTCEAIINMSSHRYCCEKMINPVVVQCLTNMLSKDHIAIVPYHEMALKCLFDLMKKDLRTLKFIVTCGGLPPLTKCWLRNKEQYTQEGVSILMNMLYMFSINEEYQMKLMNNAMYQMLLNTLDDTSEFSRNALLVLNQYVDSEECRNYFIKFEGAKIVIAKIKSTPNEKILKDILIFLKRMFIYKRIGMVFIKEGGLQVLKSICVEARTSIPIINQLITMIYDLYLPIKFHDLGRLEVTDQISNGFHLIKCSLNNEFVCPEILEKQQVSSRNTIYLVNFTPNTDELTKKPMKLPSYLNLQEDSHSNTSLDNKPISILKSSSATRHKSSATEFLSKPIFTCKVPPPMNYGFISEDPYLSQYAERVKQLMLNNKKYIMCFQHQVKLLAKYVNDILSGPERKCDNHCLEVHIAHLKEKLGVNIIPIGYLRCGEHCEKALLFKALADKVAIPATLVRGQIPNKNTLLFWNEVPIVKEETTEDEESKSYIAYAVVDLINNIGNLMLIGSVESKKYCGLPS